MNRVTYFTTIVRKENRKKKKTNDTTFELTTKKIKDFAKNKRGTTLPV